MKKSIHFEFLYPGDSVRAVIDGVPTPWQPMGLDLKPAVTVDPDVPDDLVAMHGDCGCGERIVVGCKPSAGTAVRVVDRAGKLHDCWYQRRLAARQAFVDDLIRRTDEDMMALCEQHLWQPTAEQRWADDGGRS